MSFKLGITGGIGSGKSLICNIFKTLGVPVYDADTRARFLTEHDPGIRNALLQYFGPEAYMANGTFNRNWIGSRVFANPEELDVLNHIVHPVVKYDYKKWQLDNVSSKVVIREAAIMFESGSNIGLDMIIAVDAPVAVRVKRVIARDKVSEERVLKVIASQMNDVERNKKSDRVILNDGIQPVLFQVIAIWSEILHKIEHNG